MININEINDELLEIHENILCPKCGEEIKLDIEISINEFKKFPIMNFFIPHKNYEKILQVGIDKDKNIKINRCFELSYQNDDNVNFRDIFNNIIFNPINGIDKVIRAIILGEKIYIKGEQRLVSNFLRGLRYFTESAEKQIALQTYTHENPVLVDLDRRKIKNGHECKFLKTILKRLETYPLLNLDQIVTSLVQRLYSEIYTINAAIKNQKLNSKLVYLIANHLYELYSYYEALLILDATVSRFPEYTRFIDSVKAILKKKTFEDLFRI